MLSNYEYTEIPCFAYIDITNIISSKVVRYQGSKYHVIKLGAGVSQRLNLTTTVVCRSKVTSQLTHVDRKKEIFPVN